MKVIGLKVPEDVKLQIEKLAEDKGITVSDLLRPYILQILRLEPEPGKKDVFDYVRFYSNIGFAYRIGTDWYRDVSKNPNSDFIYGNDETEIFVDDLKKEGNNSEFLLILKPRNNFEYLNSPTAFYEALKQGIDIFGLIDAGCAITEERAATINFLKD